LGGSAGKFASVVGHPPKTRPSRDFVRPNPVQLYRRRRAAWTAVGRLVEPNDYAASRRSSSKVGNRAGRVGFAVGSLHSCPQPPGSRTAHGCSLDVWCVPVGSVWVTATLRDPRSGEVRSGDSGYCWAGTHARAAEAARVRRADRRRRVLRRTDQFVHIAAVSVVDTLQASLAFSGL